MDSGARKDKACDVLGISVRTIERWDGTPVKDDLRKGPITEPANKLSSNEKKAFEKISKAVNQLKVKK